MIPFNVSHSIKLTAALIVSITNCSITLILVADKTLYSEWQIDGVLEMVYDSMVLLLGLDDLISFKNVERFKRDIRVREYDL